jgi:hypothetical protein
MPSEDLPSSPTWSEFPIASSASSGTSNSLTRETRIEPQENLSENGSRTRALLHSSRGGSPGLLQRLNHQDFAIVRYRRVSHHLTLGLLATCRSPRTIYMCTMRKMPLRFPSDSCRLVGNLCTAEPGRANRMVHRLNRTRLDCRGYVIGSAVLRPVNDVVNRSRRIVLECLLTLGCRSLVWN